MKLLIPALLVLLPVMITFLIMATRRVKPAAVSTPVRTQWDIEESTGADQVYVLLQGPKDSQQLLIGSVDIMDPEFEMELELLRSQAQSRAVALNAQRTPSRQLRS